MATPLESGGSDLRCDINVTPLVDVMLVLLVIFMVVTPLLREDIPVLLPEAEQAKATEDMTQVTLTLSVGGEIRLNGRSVPRSELRTELRSLFANRAEKTIFLESDRGLDYGSVVDAMDECRAAGVTQIGVLTKRPEAAARSS